MENEVRHILREAVADDGERTGNLVGTIRKRFQSVGGVELRLPVREPMRELPKLAK
jgi:plasmid stability protein